MTDVEGHEFSGLTEARAQAIKTRGEMMRDAPDAFWGSRPWSVVVTDASGLVSWEIFVDGVSAAAAPS